MKRLIVIINILSIVVIPGLSAQNSNVDAYINKAIESEKMGKEMDAIGYLTTAIQLAPKNVKALTERASLFVIFGDYQSALKDYRSALKLEPSEELYYKTGVAELNSGDDKKAIEHLTEAIKLNPKNEFYYFFRGEAELDLGKITAAISDFDLAIELKPNDYRAIFTRGKCYFSVHDYKRAIVDFTAAEKMYSYNPELYFYRASSYFNLSKFNEAIADFSVALEKDPDNHDALIYRAQSYEFSNKFKEADSDYSKFMKEHSITPQIAYAAANVKYSLADYPGAETTYTKVIDKQPNHKMAFFHRGMARFNQRKIELACADFTKAKNLGYLAGYDQMKGNCK